jgi:hypothetical protein
MANANESSAKTSAYTAGPWYLYDDGTEDGSSDCVMATRGDEKADIAYMSSDDATAVPIDERKANARLIATAPELLCHLESIVEMAFCVAANWTSGDLASAVRSLEQIAAQAEETIAKARGKAA